MSPEEMFDEDLTDWAKNVLRPLYERYLKRAREVWCGRNRVVFDMGCYVVKLPRNANGFEDNDWEGSISNSDGSNPEEDIQYARTRMHFQMHAKGEYLPVVFMEKVDWSAAWEGKGYDDLPDWVGSVDCGQVGLNKHGKLVVFDYGLR